MIYESTLFVRTSIFFLFESMKVKLRKPILFLEAANVTFGVFQLAEMVSCY